MLEESCPIEVFAAELRRRIQESPGDAQKNLQTLSGLDTKIEALITEKLARERGMWVEFSQISLLGTPFPSGVENEVYLNSHGNLIYKVNNLMTSKSLLSLFDRLILHNSIFPQTGYLLSGFTGFSNGNIYPILRQDFIPNEREATPIEIDMYMAAIGFQKTSEAKYSNEVVEVSDLHPRNVLRDSEGDLYVIDAEFRKI
jgi:hypothetical protein